MQTMSRKMPVVLLLVVGILAAYAIHNYNLNTNGVRGEFNENVLAREERLGRFLDDLAAPARSGKFDVIRKRAEMLRQAEILDFYILKDGDSVIWWGATELPLERVDKPYVATNEPVFEPVPGFTYVSMALEDGFALTVGINKDFDAYYETRKDFIQNFVIQDVILVSIIVIIVSLWSLKDIRLIFAQMKKGDMKGLSRIESRSRESELFLRGFSGFAQSVDDLEFANELLGKQILPSLKKEIFSGKKPPYDFNCTLVRVDINNFSTIYNTHDVTSFMQVINEFFVEVSHLVTRYGGLIHEFVGDEVIIYFKDDDHPHSFLIALSAIRDVNRIAEDFNSRTAREFGYPFTVKSSLAHGRVRFGPLVNGYTVAGSVLIETVRILSNIHEKDGNVCFFDKANADRLHGVVKFREAQAVKLKGFNGERMLCAYESHRPIEEVLQNLSSQNVYELDFYRSDEDLVKILTYLRKNTDKLTDKLVLQALMHLRGAKVTKSHDNLSEIILSWCEELSHGTERTHMPAWMTIASSLAKLMISLVPEDKFTPVAAERLKLLLTSKDRRVVANVFEVLTHFGVAQDKRVEEALDLDHDSRIAANALVHSARDEISKKDVRGLWKMLRSQDEQKVASGLFALGEIASTHRKRDYVYFSTQIPLKDMIVSLPTYLKSTNPMVRRQAVLAAVKIGEPEILSEFEKRIWASATLSRELKGLLPSSQDAA